MRAYILVTTKSGAAEDVAKIFRNEKNVVSAECIYGRFDVIIIIETSNMKNIDKIVHKLQKNPGVVHTETAITHYLHELEDEYHRENLKSIGGIE